MWLFSTFWLSSACQPELYRMNSQILTLVIVTVAQDAGVSIQEHMVASTEAALGAYLLNWVLRSDVPK